MKRLLPPLFLAWFLVPFPTATRAADPFQFAAGDRVALLGNTLIEREQRHGYWETALTARFSDRNLTFRNLGWSGDTVFGDARAVFGTTADGFRHLKNDVFAVKPTVIVVGYGSNESFDGAAGLPRFVSGLNTLLDTLAPTKARFVLLSPLRQEDLGRPLPQPAEQNKNLALYRDALQRVADQRGYPFVDLYALLDEAKNGKPLTENGIHLTAYGYWRSAAAIERGLELPPIRWRIDLDATGKNVRVEGVRLDKVQAAPLRFLATDVQLPPPPPPLTGLREAPLAGGMRVLRVRGLAPGKYVLRNDGKVIATAIATEWDAGVDLTRGPEFDQAEALRTLIVAKNRLYFHRWRPENETYLFGFRKQEQGQNAKEVPEFEPLVAGVEAEIAKLRAPVTHTLELTSTP